MVRSEEYRETGGPEGDDTGKRQYIPKKSVLDSARSLSTSAVMVRRLLIRTSQPKRDHMSPGDLGYDRKHRAVFRHQSPRWYHRTCVVTVMQRG